MDSLCESANEGGGKKKETEEREREEKDVSWQL